MFLFPTVRIGQVCNVILNRRKSIAGKSLEHHLATIFTAARLELKNRQLRKTIKTGFLFPNGEAYHNLLFPSRIWYFWVRKQPVKTAGGKCWMKPIALKQNICWFCTFAAVSNCGNLMKHEHLNSLSRLRTVPRSTRISTGNRDIGSFVEMVKMKQNSKSIYSV